MHYKYSYQSNMIYKRLEFFQINEAPHEILENAIDNILIFQENNVIFALDHWPKLGVLFKMGGARHLDVTTKLFTLCYEYNS